MPKILARQPAWLDRNTPAFDFFQPADGSSSRPDAQDHEDRDAPARKIAHRGTEIFAVVGNELRWSDLGLLKDGNGQQQPAYKVLKTPAYKSIQQLSISPSGDLLAVLTTHTCHICVLPSHEHLNFHDEQPLKLRSFQLGPTAHVIDQAPLVSAVWHPLSPSGNGLVTVTKDAGVRLWELDINNRSSFNEPALAVDLKKLSNASTVREDFSASKYGVNKGYSADDVEMQVAGSCFGGNGAEDEDGWSSMTLWIAMTEGDVYALCPFLPTKFWAPASLLPTLSTSIIAKTRVLDQDRQVSELERRIAHQQSNWLADLDEQDPTTIPGDTNNMDVFSRPERPGVIPRLQGPFQLTPDADFGEITDIHVIAPKLNDEDLFDDEDDYAQMASDEGLSVGIVCLATKTSKVHICLNTEGVEAEWLPSKRSRALASQDVDDVRELLLFETIDLARAGQESGQAWPTFTPSPTDRYELFTTQPSGIYSISLRSWISDLENELSATQVDATNSIGFRLKIILESANSDVETILEFAEPQQDFNAALAVLSEFSDLGYIVLTTASNKPQAAILDIPTFGAHPFLPEALTTARPITSLESRAPYQPDDILFHQSSLPTQLELWRRESATGSAGDIKGTLRFSPYTLQKVTEAHRILSSETHSLGTAVGDLFRRCERMMNELRAQVDKIRELSNRVNSVTGEDEFPEQKAGEPELVRGGRYRIQSRIEARRAKTEEIQERVERLRGKIRGLGGKELSAKEEAFLQEVGRLQRSVLPPPPHAKPTTPEGLLRMGDSEPITDSLVLESGEEEETLIKRFTAVQEIYAQLIAQASVVQKELDSTTTAAGSSSAGGESRRNATSTTESSSSFRARKLENVWALLERETALVDAVGERLEKLRVGAAL